MGLFSRRKEKDPSSEPPAPLHAPVVPPDNLDAVDRLLTDFAAAFERRSAQTNSDALLAIAEASGYKGDEWATRTKALLRDHDLFKRPWTWLADAAEAAAEAGEPTIAARVALAFKAFSETLAPLMNINDSFATGVSGPIPESDRVRTHSAVVTSLALADPQAVVFDGGEETVTAEVMLAYSADELLKLDEAGVRADPVAREIAIALQT